MSTACITGITGQTGSYLCDLLLAKGYKVYGLKRRSSSFNTERVDHVDGRIELAYGDLSDYSSISSWVGDIKPDLFFNMGAQSHVRVSFDIPEYTMDITGTGVLRVLEAIRKNSPATKFLTASSSEMFGSTPPPQNEATPFHPRSPYGVAKVAGYYATVNYREAYGLHACNAISFNHETVAGFMPVIFKEGKTGDIDIKPISEVVKHHTLHNKIMIDEELKTYQEGPVEKELYIWDKGDWTKVKFASAYPHDLKNNKLPSYINARNSCYLATGTHAVIMSNKEEKMVKDLAVGDSISNIEYPTVQINDNFITVNEAELLGFIIGDGSLNSSALRLTAKNKDELEYYSSLWTIMGGTFRFSQTVSGFKPENNIWQLNLTGKNEWIKKFMIYDSYHNKRIPKQILNANIDIMKAFLHGYNKADGLKKNPCRYEFKNFKTNSATLASGLLFLINKVTKQDFNITIEETYKYGFRSIYYSINLLSNNPASSNPRNSFNKYETVKRLLSNGYSARKITKNTGISAGFISKVKGGYIPTTTSHLQKPSNEIKKILNFSDYDGWFYDLETESGTFHCGIGLGHVHNSPRRGETFVTRKITRAAARIKFGLQDRLLLGNLDAKRDWSHAHDVAEAMYKIVTAPVADDYVVSSGEMHSVEEFTRLVFDKLNLDYTKHVGFEPRYLRPSEVDALCGDSSKLKTNLGWQPQYDFISLIDEMIEFDMELARKEKLIRG